MLAVGSAVIDATPTPVKEWAVAELGSADKPVLVGSVLAGTLVAAAVAGMVGRRRFAPGAALLLALVGLATATALSQPGAGLFGALPGLVAGAVGVGALWVLLAPGGVGGHPGDARAVRRSVGSGACAPTLDRVPTRTRSRCMRPGRLV